MSTKKMLRTAAAMTVSVVLVLGIGAGFFTPYSYAHQFRDLPNAAPCAGHLLGTDALGRDLFTRVLYGTRISLVLAPAAAAVSTVLAALLGATAGFLGGWCQRVILGMADLAIALPLLFVLIVLRALLPLGVAPALSVVATFLVLGLLGWPSSLRVICAAAQTIRQSDFLLLARCLGCHPKRLITRQILPNLLPVLFAQFWVAIPTFILTEATLSMLGLGVIEPMPSWGNLLRGLENVSALTANPWRITPLVLIVVVVVCLQFLLPSQEDLA